MAINLLDTLGANSLVSKVAEELNKNTENAVLEELNELVSRGILVLHRGPTVVVQDPFSNKIEIRQKVRVVLSNQEYVERLESENKKMKNILDLVNQCLPKA